MTTYPFKSDELVVSVCGHCGATFAMTKHDNRRRYCSTECSSDHHRSRSRKSLLRQQQRDDDRLRAVWLGKLWTKGTELCSQT